MRYAKQMLVMMTVLTPLLASAQLGHSVSIVTQVPFQFVVGDRVVPAGQCILQAANAGVDTIVIRNDASMVRLFSSTSVDETRTAPATNQLLFRQYGNRYFLAAVRLQGSRVMYEIPESRGEAELRLQNQTLSQETIHAF